MMTSTVYSAPPRPFRRAAVLGAGVMGAQIAAHLANAGLSVLLLDMPTPESKSPDKNAGVQQALKKMLKMKPSPVVDAGVKERISTGNFEDDLSRIAEADWIIEVIIERLDAKKQLMAKIEAHAAPDAIISTNTSGLPVHQIVSDCGEDFRKRFLCTHFFNPPRYLKLLELVPTPETDAAVMQRIQHFGRVHLGKGVVQAKDTPNFIANRVGTYSMMLAVRMLSEEYSMEEIDALTGTLTGRPKSATFRTADVVGLDTLSYVSQNLYDAIPHDPDREMFRLPDVLQKLVESGRTGSKTGRGFYFKDGKEIKALNPQTMDYEPRKTPQLSGLDEIRSAGGLSERWKALYRADSKAGRFIREHTTRLIAYAMNRVPEISDIPYDVDRAIEWGFGWQMGPFAICDAIGPQEFARQAAAMKLELPAWFSSTFLKQEQPQFFRYDGTGALRHYRPDSTDYETAQLPADELGLHHLKSKGSSSSEVWSNPEAALLDSGDGILIYEFRSKANTLGFQVIQGLLDAIEIMESGSWRGMVIANEGTNFSVGANLGELAAELQRGNMKAVERAVANFQKAALAVRYAEKPVVVALRGKALGGGCELSMGAAGVVAATETYMGLVELGVGLIPAGSGTMTMVARAGERAATEHPSDIQPFLQQVFETIAMAKVATSGQEAVQFGYIPDSARIAMNENRRVHIARQEVIRLTEQGYLPPPVRSRIFVPGAAGFSPLKNAAWQLQQSGWISPYDAFLAERLAHVMCGGDLYGPEYVHEDYLIELEREVFMFLLGEEKTRARIQSILTTNKPLRN